ncbi:MAG TPA: hypothetical protein DCF49_04620 [Lachnospiraceae bacterium]|nr:hypothetical protein [Lachnospiraceae bacterium]
MELLDKLQGKVDGALMKKIAIVAMFIDHMTLCFLEVAKNEMGVRIMYTFPAGETLDSIGRGIGRLAFPVFCFLIVEGFYHTRNRWKYLIRLLIFAAVSQVPFVLLVFPESQKPHADTIFTLAVGYSLIWCVDVLRRHMVGEDKLLTKLMASGEGAGAEKADFGTEKVLRLIVWTAVSAGLTYAACRLAKWRGMDYSYGGVICILLLYLFYEVRDLAVTTAWLWLTFYNHNELLAFTGFVLIRCYNGKRGRQNKYFFYLFYPGHLLLLYLIRKAIFGI